MEKVNLHIYPSVFKHESRILKETKSLIDNGVVDRIVVVAVWQEGLPEWEKIDDKREVWRVKLPQKKKRRTLVSEGLRYYQLMRRVYSEYKNAPVTHINCHSIGVLPIGVFFKRKRKSITLIYDAHELETETVTLHGIRQKFVKFLERRLMPYVDKLIVVSDSIADWYKKEYNISNVYVVKNVPYNEPYTFTGNSIFKEKFKIPGDQLLFIYQGLISKGRGITIMIEVFSRLPDKHLVIMGYGPMEDVVKQAVAKYPNIHFHEAVKPHEIIHYTSGADVGICLGENVCLSYYYGLANKIFEYIMCGLPIIVSNYPDMGAVVDKYGCGWKSEVSTEGLMRVVKNITVKTKEEKRERTLQSRALIGWHVEERELLKAYER